MVGVIVATSILVSALAGAQSATPGDYASPAGDWRGMSVCQVKRSACNDEDSLYHVRAIAGKQRAFELQADKIVDGRPVTMGTSLCDLGFDGRLACAISKGTTLVFDLRGDELRGTMKLANGTVWRKLTLKRQRR